MSETCFSTKPRFSSITSEINCIIAALNASMQTGIPCQIRSSKRGLSISIDGKVVASGKTPAALYKAFSAVFKKANS